MATILGFDTDAFSRTINEGAQDYRQGMVKSITDLGTRVSEIIERKATNSQLQSMSQDLRGLDIRSESFPLEMIDVVSRYPLAVKDKRGQLALGILGSAHKNYTSRTSGGAAPYSALPGVPGTLFNRRTGEVKETGVDIPEKPEPTQVVQTPTGYEVVGKRTGEVISTRDLPEKAAKAEAAAEFGRKRLAISELGAARQILTTQSGAVERRLSALQKQAKAEGSALNEFVWQKDGKWYKATPAQILKGQSGERGMKETDYQTPIDASEAKRIQERNTQFDELNAGVEALNSKLMQLDERMNELLSPRSMETGDELFPAESPPPQPSAAPPQARVRRFNPATGRIE